MSTNKDLGLPYGEGMERIAVCFDVDGTLIEENMQYPSALNLLEAFLVQPFKNVDVIVWSGGGADYARTMTERFLPASAGRVKQFASKLQHKEIKAKYHKVIALDDIQDTRLGDANMIVRNK